MSCRKIATILLAGSAVFVAGVVLIFVFALANSSDKHINILDETFYKNLIQDKASYQLPKSASIIASEDSVQGFGMENELNARCLLQLKKSDFDSFLEEVKKDSAFKVDNSTALTKIVTNKQPEKVLLAAQKLKLLSKDFTNVYTKNKLGSYWFTIGFHENRKFIFINYVTY